MKKLLLLIVLLVGLKCFAQYVSPKTDSVKIDSVSASFYAGKFQGRKAANGSTFSQNKLTCASNKYPLNTKIVVYNPKTNKSVTVTVTDRMHPRYKEHIDLSQKAYKQIAELKTGRQRVFVSPVDTSNRL